MMLALLDKHAAFSIVASVRVEKFETGARHGRARQAEVDSFVALFVFLS